MQFIRYQSAIANERGAFTGIFGLANGLARSGRLSAADWTWWRRNNDWFDHAYPDPAASDPALFDKQKWPELSCWFRLSATHLLSRVPGYLDLLDRYAVPWVELRSADPGIVVYADEVQVVVRPRQRPPDNQAA